jgi:hypothetical protein
MFSLAALKSLIELLIQETQGHRGSCLVQVRSHSRDEPQTQLFLHLFHHDTNCLAAGLLSLVKARVNQLPFIRYMIGHDITKFC